MSTKASLTKVLRERGIPFPEDATLAVLQHRVDTWLPGNGFLFRRMKVRRYASVVFPRGIVAPEVGQVVWIPNSDFAREVFKTKAMWFLGRKPFSDKFTLLDVPMSEELLKKASKPAPKKKAPAKKKKTLAKKVEEVSESDGDGSANS